MEVNDLQNDIKKASKNAKDKKAFISFTKILDFCKSWFFLIPPIILNVLGIIMDLFGLEAILLSFLIIVLVILLSFGMIYIYFNRLKKQKLFEDVSDQISDEMKLMLNQYWSGPKPGIPGIMLDEDLAKFEKNIDCSEIWLVSYDLQTEFNEGLYRDVVLNNLKRGIHYKYFVAKTPGIVNRIDTEVIDKLPEECKEFFDYRLLKDDFFFLVENIDFVIYDPYKSSFSGRKAYMSLVTPDTGTIYEAPMNNDLLDRIISRLMEYIESE